MATVHYINDDGERHTVDVEDGMTLMEGAQLNSIPGIVAECGGMCSCATCHCYIKGEWAAKLPAMAEAEKKMLQTANQPQDSSRLSCQIIMDDSLEGIEVHIPSSQY
jgi:2Fe-2S ferredoxin